MDTYASNTALYQDPSVIETVDYARRWHRQELCNDGAPGPHVTAKSTILAPHGGGIEPGTSELCLAIAGYHPATLDTIHTAVRDYWMFEAVRRSNNAPLHVTSTHCDDGVALSLCGGSLNALAVHGFDAAQAGLPDDAQVVVVGGRSTALNDALRARLAEAQIQTTDAVPSLDGNNAVNIANRTLLGMGSQLELSGALRKAMFTTNTIAHRKDTTTELFWTFTAACRNALAQLEATQSIL